MRVTENQLLVLLATVKKAVDGTLEEELNEPGIREALSSLYDEIMIQQNEIVDTSNYANPTRDQILRLALDMFEAFEVTADNPEDFYRSPLGRRACPLLYPELEKRRQEAEDGKEE